MNTTAGTTRRRSRRRSLLWAREGGERESHDDRDVGGLPDSDGTEHCRACRPQRERRAGGAPDDAVHWTHHARISAALHFLATSCEELNPNARRRGSIGSIRWFVAAFRPESDPGISSIQFGIRHNLPVGQGYISWHSACGPSFTEVPDAGWPETGLGDLLAFGTPVHSTLFTFYCFSIYRENDDSYFGTWTHPSTDQASFGDDSEPPVEDRIYNFGTIRWQVPGENHCPQPPTGEVACCFSDGTCRGAPIR